jgi:hypothetical protein
VSVSIPKGSCGVCRRLRIRKELAGLRHHRP